MKLTEDYFQKLKTLDLARNLIGKVFVHETKNGIIKGIINETEAYIEEDEASKTYLGKRTKQNSILYEKAGKLYIYLTYGMYYCSNIVSGKENKGESVFIRSVIPIEGIEIIKKNRNWFKDNLKGLVDGPAKFSKGFNLNKNLNGYDIFKSNSKIYLEDLNFKPKKILNTTRIGISKGKHLKYRFYSENFFNL